MRIAIGALCLASMLAFVGCGKKDSDKTKKVAFAATESLNLAKADQDIPTVDYENAKFFEDDEVADFAFVDDELASQLNEQDTTTLAANLAEELNEALDADEEALAWEEDEETSIFKTVQFDLNKNNIRDDQKDNMKTNIAAAKELVERGEKLVITGHTCSMGSPSYNLALSEKRAKAIRDEMVRSGIAEENIQIIGAGSEIPLVASNATERAAKIQDLAPNRRAVITVS